MIRPFYLPGAGPSTRVPGRSVLVVPPKLRIPSFGAGLGERSHQAPG
jgi:hypothetical protein